MMDTLKWKMSIDKWLNDKDFAENRKKREDVYKKLQKEEVIELKKKSIKNLVNSQVKSYQILEDDNLLTNIIEFKDWLNNRTYLKGDIAKIETWILNLAQKVKTDNIKESNLTKRTYQNSIVEEFRKIPPKFLDEKTRIALNKKLRGIKRTTSDNYYLRKLKNLIQEKLKEAEYYEILKTLLEI